MEFREFSEIPDDSGPDAEREARKRARREAEELEWQAAQAAKEQAELHAREQEAQQAEAWEREQQEAREAWEAREAQEREAREAAEEALAEAKQKFDDKLADQKRRCDDALKEIEERAGEERADSLKRLDKEGKALADLARDHEQSVREAADDALPKETGKHIAEFQDKVNKEKEALEQRSCELRREESAEQGHVLRVPGLVEMSAAPLDRVIITHVARMMLTVAANHIVPGHGALLVRAAEMFIQACAAPGKLDRASGIQISVPFTICDGLVTLNVGTRLSDDAGPAGSMPLTLGFSPNFGGQPGSHRPQVKLVDAAPRPGKTDNRDQKGIKELVEEDQRRRSEARRRLRESAMDAQHEPASAEDDAAEQSPPTAEESGEASTRQPSETADERPAATRTDHPGESAAREPAHTRAGETLETRTEQHQVAGGEQLGPAATGQWARLRPTGVVISGSARAIAAAAHRSLVTPDLLLSLARNTAWDQLYDGTPGSVAAALDAVQCLEVVVFLDFDIGGGLWIDVDPVTQEPCATLLVDLKVSANVLERFRLFYCTP